MASSAALPSSGHFTNIFSGKFSMNTQWRLLSQVHFVADHEMKTKNS